MYKEVRDVLEEQNIIIDECDMKGVDVLDVSEKTVAILGKTWWPQAAKQEGDKMSQTFPCKLWKQCNERPTVGGVSIWSKNGAASRKGCGQWSND